MRVLVVRTGGLGDCILTLPVISRLHSIFQDSAIDILGNAAMRDTGALTGLSDCHYDIDDPLFLPLFTGRDEPVFNEFISRYDCVYIFSVADPEPIEQHVMAAGVHHCSILDPRPPSTHRRHITKYLLSICDKTDNTVELPSPHVSPMHARHGLIVHPGSGSLSKNWPPDRFRAVVDAWGDDCTVLLGPAEHERGLAGIFDGLNTICPETVADLCRALLSASLYLGNDSGGSHCAAWCRTPGVALFGPSDPEIWGPVGAMTTVIMADSGDMEEIGIDVVITALRQYTASA